MKLKNWLSQSNRWKHLLGGFIIGLGANDIYCALYAGTGVAGALELKDKLRGGLWDWIDFGLTVIGAAAGYGSRALINLVIG